MRPRRIPTVHRALDELRRISAPLRAVSATRMEKAGDMNVAGLGNVMKEKRHLTLRMRMMSAAAMSTTAIATTNTHA